jgi:hypothetical protein
MDNDLIRNVAKKAETYERLIELLSSDDIDGLALMALADELGYDGVDDADELLNEFGADDVLEIVGVWEGARKDDLSYKGCRVVVAVGGPHIELDTARRRWCGRWAGDKVELTASTEVCDYFDGMVEDS